MSRQACCCPHAGARLRTLPAFGRLQESGLLEGRSYWTLLYPDTRGNGSPTKGLDTCRANQTEISRHSISSFSENLQFSKITTPKSPSPAHPSARRVQKRGSTAAPQPIRSKTHFDRCAPRNKRLRNAALKPQIIARLTLPAQNVSVSELL